MASWKSKMNREPPYDSGEVILRYMGRDGIPWREFDLRQVAAKRIGRRWWENLWIWRRN